MLGSTAVAGALVIGWGLVPPRQRLTGSAPLPVVPQRWAFNGWVRIGSDNGVVVQVPRSEMGQGVHTALAMLLADELDADWAAVRVEHPPLDAIYNNQAAVIDGLPFHPDSNGLVKRLAGWLTAKVMREFGLQFTGGSSSVKDLWFPMREAGASARAMLVAAAAAQWGVKVDEVQVASGVLSHASGRRLTFGELAASAAQQPLPRRVVLKTPAQFRLLGQSRPRLESTDKITGRAVFGLDVQLPGMLYATVSLCPTLGGRVKTFDGAAALKMPGVRRVLAVGAHRGGTAGVAVIADTPWQAMKGLAAVVVQWDEDVAAAQFDSASALQRLARSLDTDTGIAYFSEGDAAGAIAGAATVVRAEYSAPWLPHMALEPINCTVQAGEGTATVWVPTQVPGLARRAVADALGLDSAAVTVNVTLLGGGFGRRLEVDYVGPAAEIAQAVRGTPVQTFWSRAEDTRHDFYRPAAIARWQAGLDAQGRLLGISAVSAGQAIVPQFVERVFGLPGGPLDKTALEGSHDQPYAWPAARFAHVRADLPVPVGFWRSVGHSHQAFFKESFVDELATVAKQDAVAFRLALLQRHPRAAAVLKLAAEKAGWGQPLAPLPDGTKRARGVALHRSFGTTVAQVVEVSVGADKAIRVHRVVAAVDCGFAVNPDHVAQQIESSVVFGLSAALGGRIDIEQGRVRQSNFHDVPPLRIDACPEIETFILPGTQPPEGMGEPGLPPLAPAVAGAVYALTGKRLRSLPLQLS